MRSLSAAVLVAMVGAGVAGCGRADTLVVLRATYGASCGQAAGNVTLAAARACDGPAPCTLSITPAVLTDPAEGCEKDFEVVWACRSGQAGARRTYLPKEATLGATAQLTCD